TSHRVADLEAYQAGAEHGPCVESMREKRAVSVATADEANARWPGFGDRMRVAGYERVYAVPMVWQGVGVGGLNLFWTDPGTGSVDGVLLQTYADILTLAAVYVRPLSADDAAQHLQEALEERGGIEQAKGVLAWQYDVDMSEAYFALLQIAEERSLTLGEAADAVVESAVRGETG
ncbi:ANTAR domain-containing protein, partial [Nocardioides sp.]|uniref:ANTAR domain-containing protein n=1 Tax=Nocardioides sp. TaxID=35761 RepID=UPI00286D9C34